MSYFEYFFPIGVSLIFTFGFVFFGLKLIQEFQKKEYRIDRFREFFRMKEGERLIWNPFGLSSILYSVITVAFFCIDSIFSLPEYIIVGETIFLIVLAMIFLVWIFVDGIRVFLRIRDTGIQRPEFTLRATILAVAMSIFSIYMFETTLTVVAYSRVKDYFSEGLIEVLRFVTSPLLIISQNVQYYVDRLFSAFDPINYFVFVFLWPVVYLTIMATCFYLVFLFLNVVFGVLRFFQKEKYAKQVRSFLSMYPKLTIVAVTGSYGKSGAKEWISTLLSRWYNTQKTPENHNTYVGVMKSILTQVTEETEIFVVEIGAYKQGEIKEICDVIRPDISLITSINEQHLGLFGSLENTKKAKYEIIESMKKYGIAIFNADDEEVGQIAGWWKGSKLLYSSKGQLQIRGQRVSMFALGLKSTSDGVRFHILDARDESENERLSESPEVVIKGLPEAFVGTVIAGITVAMALGKSAQEIAREITTIGEVRLGIQAVQMPRGNVIYDNSYSTNPNSFVYNVGILSQSKKRRVLVTKGILELGKSMHRIHRFLAEYVGSQVDEIILLDSTFKVDFEFGLSKLQNPPTLKVFDNVQPARVYLKSFSDSVFLFEGRIPQIYLHDLRGEE